MNIDVDDDLLAQSLSGSSPRKQTVERALTLMVEVGRQSEVRRLRGKLSWDGDREERRRDESGSSSTPASGSTSE